MKNAAELKVFVQRFASLMESGMPGIDDLSEESYILQKFTHQLQLIVNGERRLTDPILSIYAPTISPRDLELLRYFHKQMKDLEPGVLWTSINSLLPKKVKQ